VVVVGDSVVVVGDAFVVFGDVVVVVGDAVIEIIDVGVEVDEVLSEGFEGDHELGFLLESVLVAVLIEDLVPFIELIDLMPEVTGWDAAVVGVVGIVILVVNLSVLWLNIFVMIRDVVIDFVVGIEVVVVMVIRVVGDVLFGVMALIVVIVIVVFLVDVVVAVDFVLVGSVFVGLAILVVVVGTGVLAGSAGVLSGVGRSEVGHVARVVEGSVGRHVVGVVFFGLDGRSDGGEDSGLESSHDKLEVKIIRRNLILT